MEDSKDLRKKVAANLRSVTQSCKGGVPFECLERDYRDLLGVSIPYKALGYSSLEAMLRAMPDVVTLERNSAGKCIVMAVADETTAHIASLIARQRSAVRKPVRSRRPVRIRKAPAASQRQASVRHFNKGSRAPPSYLESDFQAHSHSSSIEQFQEPTRSIPPYNSEPLVQSPRQKAAPPTTFGPKYEIPPRFLRKQEKPLTSLENNSTDDQFGLASSTAFNYANRQPVVERTVTCASADGYFPTPSPYKFERTTYETPRSAREFIENYAQRNKLACNYSTVSMGQRRKSFISVLQIGNEKFRNYPNGEPTPEKAEEAVAEIARQAISEREDLSKMYPIAAVDDPQSLDMMLNRIDQIVAEKPKGIWSNSIPSVYEQKYQVRLPEEWFSLVKKYCSFYFTKVDDSRIILYPGSDSGRASPSSNVSNQDDDISEELESKLNVAVPLLQLPPGNEFPVFVCNVHDTQWVAVRLVDYADEFEELSEQMKKFYSENKCPVSNVTFDKPYAVPLYGLWHRALVEEVKGDKVSCQLVDEGDVVEVPRDCLQELDSHFVTNVPFQAVFFKLAHLEAYSMFVDIETLKYYLLGKTLIAHLLDSGATSVVLYDTSTDEDIILNRIIFDKTVAESLNYTLPECGSSAVGYITHVSPTGTVYLTFNPPSTTNLLLEELARITPACEERSKQGCDISETSVYCARYGTDCLWYRAIILDTALERSEVEVLYVDFGNTSWVPLSSICELKPISEYLAELPFQAVRCHLSELPPRNRYWSDKAVQRLVELVPYDKELIVRVQKPGTETELPEVSLFIRNEQSQIVSINQTLAYDDDLFSQRPSKKHDRLPSWTKEFHSEFNKEYTPLPSSPYRSRVSNSPALVENSTNGQGNLSNLIPDVAVSAEQQLAKRHGNRAAASPANGNEGDNEKEEFPPLYPSDVPDVGSYYDIFVTMAASPFNFMCQPLKSSVDLDQLSSEMQSFYSNEENLCEMHSVLVRQGEFFAGKHSDGNWYRVRKQSIVSEDPLEVSVHYVDYGDMCILPLPKLQPLFKQFKTLPCQCMRASLKGVKPNGHDWDPLECFEFKTMVEEKKFVSVIKSKEIKVEDHMTIYCLELVLIDVSDPKVDVFIHEELIKNKMAQEAK